ncbi:MAG: tetratricopeptide repeat protein [Akkermansiaceae bacterium]|nr:tetratricopeptide repeat protein [Akkermansiaceae bacterium]
MNRKPKKTRRARSREPQFVSVAPETVSGAPDPTGRRFRGWRGWLLRLVLLVLAPTLFVAMLEGGLRLGGYGYPTGFFLGSDAKGGFATNYRFGWRFFPRSLSRDPHPCVLGAKPAGTLRIFVLGGSAAMGTPDPSFSFGRILEVMLREQYPTRKFEVVNAAMTAINSVVVREIARDCAVHEPDLFVVYMGNNEVVGPFGPGTVFQQWSPNQALIRASLRVKSTRVGQLLGNVLGGLRRKEDTLTAWRGMGMFLQQTVAADDPRLQAVHGNFGNNLSAICRIARDVNAPVVLSNVAVNLSSCPPFASAHRPGLSSTELTAWETLYQAGGAMEAARKWPEAREKFEAAAGIDDRFAELQFRIGRCLLKMDRLAEARERLKLARDLDGLRFRADSTMDATIRAAAVAGKSSGVYFVDAEAALAEGNPEAKGICGGDVFYEHVHFTFDGNYLLARAMLEQVRAALPQLADVPPQGEVPSRHRCAELLALTPWDESQLVAEMVAMTSKAPFTNQWNHDQFEAAIVGQRDRLAALASRPEAKTAAWRTYETAIARSPDDWSLHRHFGRMALEWGRPEVAVEHLRIAVASLPREGPLHVNLGNALAALGKTTEAISHFTTALELNPEDELAHFNLGNALLSRGETDKAIAQFQRALEIKPQYGSAHYNLGNLLARLGRIEEAISQFQKTLEVSPDDAQAHTNLGSLLAGQGKLDEAIVHFQKAAEILPNDVSVRQNLDRARAQRGRR